MDLSTRAPGRSGRVFRWGRIAALLLAAAAFVASLLAPWTRIDLTVLVYTQTNDMFFDNEIVSDRLWQTGLPGFLFAGLGGLALVLAGVAAAVSRPEVRRVLAAATGAVAAIAFVDLQVARIRFYPRWDETVDKFAELTRGAAVIDPAARDAVNLQINTSGIALGVVAMVVVAMIAVTIVRPGSGARVTAAVGTLLVLVSLTTPWATTYRVSGDGVDHYHEWWFQLGPSMTAVVAGSLVFVGLVWWAVLRRSTRGRLVLLLCSLPLTPALYAAELNAPIQADDRVSAADLAPYLNIDTETRAGFELNLFAVLVLGVASLLAWRAARSRAREERQTGPRPSWEQQPSWQQAPHQWSPQQWTPPYEQAPSQQAPSRQAPSQQASWPGPGQPSQRPPAGGPVEPSS